MTATATASPKARRNRTTASGGIVLSGDRLKSIVRELAPAVPSRTPNCVLQHILFRDGLAIGTDQEIRIEVPVPEAAGETMLVPFARLAAISDTISGADEVRLSLDGSACVVESSVGTWRLPTENPAEYPAGQSKVGRPIGRLPAEQLVSLLGAVSFAVEKASSRYALGGVCVEFARGDASDPDGTITFVATDGRRMAIAEAKVGSQDLDDSQTLVPLRGVAALMRIAKNAEAVQMSATSSEFIAVVGDYTEGEGVTGVTIRAQLVEGRFPRWRDSDKRHNVAASKVAVGDLQHAIRAAGICTSETSKGVLLQVTPAGLHITASAAETGTASVQCALESVGHEVEIRIDPRFAAQWLSCGSFAGAEVVSIEAVSKSESFVMRLENFRTIIMPLSDE
jgi:DNA polymerase-3 subunit beta